MCVCVCAGWDSVMFMIIRESSAGGGGAAAAMSPPQERTAKQVREHGSVHALCV